MFGPKNGFDSGIAEEYLRAAQQGYATAAFQQSLGSQAYQRESEPEQVEQMAPEEFCFWTTSRARLQGWQARIRESYGGWVLTWRKDGQEISGRPHEVKVAAYFLGCQELEPYLEKN